MYSARMKLSTAEALANVRVERAKREKRKADEKAMAEAKKLYVVAIQPNKGGRPRSRGGKVGITLDTPNVKKPRPGKPSHVIISRGLKPFNKNGLTEKEIR